MRPSKGEREAIQLPGSTHGGCYPSRADEESAGPATSAVQDKQCLNLRRWAQTAGASQLSEPCEIHVWPGPMTDFIHK